MITVYVEQIVLQLKTCANGNAEVVQFLLIGCGSAGQRARILDLRFRARQPRSLVDPDCRGLHARSPCLHPGVSVGLAMGRNEWETVPMSQQPVNMKRGSPQSLGLEGASADEWRTSWLQKAGTTRHQR